MGRICRVNMKTAGLFFIVLLCVHVQSQEIISDLGQGHSSLSTPTTTTTIIIIVVVVVVIIITREAPVMLIWLL